MSQNCDRACIYLHCIVITLQVIHQTRETVHNHISNIEKRVGYYALLFRTGARAPPPEGMGNVDWTQESGRSRA